MRGPSPRFGLSTVHRPQTSPAELLDMLRRHRFTAAEINRAYLDRFGEAITVLAEGLETLVFHLPHDREHRVLCRDPSGDDAAVERHRRIVERAVELGARTFVFHLMNICGQRLEDYWDRAVALARRVGDLVAGRGAVVGLENCYPVVRFGPVARRFLKEVDHPAVGLTLDCGHFWSAFVEDELGRAIDWPLWGTPAGAAELNSRIAEMVDCVGERIVNVHAHDLRLSDWKDHQPVGSGITDFDLLFDALDRASYRRTVVVEIRPTGGDWSGFETSVRFLRRFMG